jgi:hypothetical protein
MPITIGLVPNNFNARPWHKVFDLGNDRDFMATVGFCAFGIVASIAFTMMFPDAMSALALLGN